MNYTRVRYILIAISLIAPASAQTQTRDPYPGFDAYVETARKTWKVPGLAVAIVRNDSVILAKGYGVKDIGKTDRVTERTVFAIGSSSKAFTAAGLAILVDEKKVSWDDPAEKHLSGFHLFDPYASRELTIRDILSHRSGLARGDMLWYGTELDRDEILRRTRFLEPSWSFRSQFGYQNLMYLAAGQITARVANMSWDDFIERRIFQPLGMSESNTTIKKLSSMRDVASPHTEIEDTVRVVPWRNIDNIAPAGSINSHVVDMAQWLRMQLGKGKYAGKQVISERQVEVMQSPHTIVPLDGTWKRFQPGAHLMAYGLGWFLSDYQGRLVVQHGGNIDGMSALVAMLPEEKLGVVVLTNMNSSGLPYVVMHKLWDLHLKTPKPRDWNAEMHKSMQELIARGREAQKKREAERVANTKPSLPIDQYAGVYVDSMYGEVRVLADGDKLRIDRGPSFQGELEHWHFDTFRARWETRSLGTSLVTFNLNAQAKVDELEMDLAGSSVSFKRRPEPAATDVRAAGGAPR
jgi:CubicO group peptidase (beta-lactamase class C family)